ncbi:MAG: DUF1080 domain-containing protein [Acidobacteriota bacterium]
MKRSALIFMMAAGVLPAAEFFDGKTLAGWTVCNGTAAYRVENGEIVGKTAVGSPNSFLCTEKTYGDFVLEYETKTDTRLNSGVQIRAHRYARETQVVTENKGKQKRTHPAGRVYGYQVETATEASGASGSVYDEARRGWVANMSAVEPCKSAFKDNEWNRYRVEARGDRIRTWVNGAACVDMVDPMDMEGFIGLQVHQFKGDPPAEVRWRNFKFQDQGRHEWKPLENGARISESTIRLRYKLPQGAAKIRLGSGVVELEPMVGDGWNELTISAHGGRVVAHVNGEKRMDEKIAPGKWTGTLVADGAAEMTDLQVLRSAK